MIVWSHHASRAQLNQEERRAHACIDFASSLTVSNAIGLDVVLIQFLPFPNHTIAATRLNQSAGRQNHGHVIPTFTCTGCLTVAK